MTNELFEKELNELKNEHKKFTDDISSKLDNIIETLKTPSLKFEEMLFLRKTVDKLHEEFVQKTDEYNKKLADLYENL